MALCPLASGSPPSPNSYMRGDAPPKDWNYLLEGNLVCYLLVAHKSSVSVYQLVFLWEAVFGFSEIFLKILSVHLPISRWVIYWCTCPHQAKSWAVLTKIGMTPHVPPSLFTQSRTEWVYVCFPGWKKSSKGVEEVKQKQQNQYKASKSLSSKTVLSSAEKMSRLEVLHQVESILKVTEV